MERSMKEATVIKVTKTVSINVRLQEIWSDVRPCFYYF